ncbi:MAG: hypothetical protein R2780_00295 [Crocinitomicaceae bacterium]|nr:hypothetical protein [Crocinitomicaceae bacterium]
MKTVKEAVDHYLPKKMNDEMSLGEIRHELQKKGDFSEVEINSICLNISDHELASLGEKKAFSFEFLNHTIFSYFMILASIAIFVFSYWRFNNLTKLSAITEVSDADFFVPIVFIIASSLFLVRHLIRVIKRKR